MPFAISVRASSARPIRALWEQVASFEDKPSMSALDYPPHITLAIYDAVSEDLLRFALDTTIKDKRVPRIRFDRIEVFPDSPLVLWAAPRFHPDLQRMHDAVHSVIEPELCLPHYRPGQWTPHCTLGFRIRDDFRAAATAFAQRFNDSFEVAFDIADCTSFYPVRVIAERALR